ncbi:CDP-alcohol phosphatidyltransferase family protein, partial [Candidatus Saccharibacteria bacterium]|nr:CDP-alcohol phosphatidyltransferase family protein [Candidatus Saccharibacteria bacterium]
MKGAPSNFPKNRGGVAKGAPINIPTILTIFRIILTIPVGVGLVADGLPGKIIATLCFVLASATDLLDGKIARKYKKVTDLGAFLDPLADKILINIVFLIFVTLGIMPMWMFVVILVRDYAVDGLR